MKVIVAFLFSALIVGYGQSQPDLSQSELIDRAFLSVNHGVRRHYSGDIFIHFKRFFTVGLGYSSTKFVVGPGSDPKDILIFSKGSFAFDRINYGTLMAGITTRSLWVVNMGITGGLTYGQYTINDNFSGTFSSPTDITYSTNYSQGFGARFRFDFAIAVNERFGLNWGIVHHRNSYQNYTKFLWGISIGMAEDRR